LFFCSRFSRQQCPKHCQLKPPYWRFFVAYPKPRPEIPATLRLKQASGFWGIQNPPLGFPLGLIVRKLATSTIELNHNFYAGIEPDFVDGDGFPWWSKPEPDSEPDSEPESEEVENG
jgi:hypothetical protein